MLYFDRNGQYRGAGVSAGGYAAWWWISILLFPFVLVLWIIPRLLWAIPWPPAAKLVLIAAVWIGVAIWGSTLH